MGPDDASQRVTGSAEDFCFLVTQRRPLATLDIAAHGADAQRWLTIAQAFAGPGSGPWAMSARRETRPTRPAVGDERAKRDTAREMSTAGCEKHGGSSSPAVTEARLAAEQRTHWQQTYAAHPHLYGDQPSEAAKNALAVFRSTGVSALLDLGSGHGRDALFFARNGIAVHVIDFSPTALQQLADTAAVQGLTGRITVTEHDIRYPLPVPRDRLMRCLHTCCCVWPFPPILFAPSSVTFGACYGPAAFSSTPSAIPATHITVPESPRR
ncbi:tellurite resistance TehB family protein [Mycobacterium xenopi 3993]|nr:tellurite resistance TehB family protein [Mycobacterium xenopi 3993]